MSNAGAWRIEHFGNCQMIEGDCREILSTLLFPVDVVVTDPPWDQARGIAGAEDPRGLFRAVAPALACAKSAVVQLGCYSDPAILEPLATLMPYRPADRGNHRAIDH